MLVILVDIIIMLVLQVLVTSQLLLLLTIGSMLMAAIVVVVAVIMTLFITLVILTVGRTMISTSLLLLRLWRCCGYGYCYKLLSLLLVLVPVLSFFKVVSNYIRPLYIRPLYQGCEL